MWILALAIAVISVLVLARFLVGGPKTISRSKIVLCGPSGAGKTALFLAQTGKKHETLMSQTVNQADSSWGSLVDTPGHAKLEALALAELTNQVKAIVYVVDGASQQLKNAAHLLYKVLLVAEKYQIPVLIAANKYDLFSTVSVAKVSQTLEKELGELRASREKSLGEADEWLGAEGDFSFNQLDTVVEIRDGSVKANRLTKWNEFIDHLA